MFNWWLPDIQLNTFVDKYMQMYSTFQHINACYQQHLTGFVRASYLLLVREQGLRRLLYKYYYYYDLLTIKGNAQVMSAASNADEGVGGLWDCIKYTHQEGAVTL